MAFERSPKNLTEANRISNRMSQPTTYEQLIAQKLQELEVPDQANSIWATIEQHLNIEMPVNGPGSGGGSTNPGWWLGGGSGGLLTIFVAAVTYIVISKQKLERDRNLNDAPASIQYKQPAKPNQDTAKNTVPLQEILKNRPPAKSEEQIQEAIAPTSDSVNIAPAPRDVVHPPVQPIQKDTVITTKKTRGVRGISDADYRIVPDKKDSTKRF